MRKLVMIGIVALSCAALAQEPEGQKVGPKGELGRRPMMSERGRMPMGGGMNGGMMGNDQAIMAVMSAIDELFDLRKEMAKTQTKRVIAVKALLTSEQLEKAVEELRKVREEKRRGMRGKDDQPPPPPPAED